MMIYNSANFWGGYESYARRFGFFVKTTAAQGGIGFTVKLSLLIPDTSLGMKEKDRGSGKEGTVKAKEVDIPCAAPPPAVLSRRVISREPDS